MVLGRRNFIGNAVSAVVASSLRSESVYSLTKAVSDNVVREQKYSSILGMMSQIIKPDLHTAEKISDKLAEPQDSASLANLATDIEEMFSGYGRGQRNLNAQGADAIIASVKSPRGKSDYNFYKHLATTSGKIPENEIPEYEELPELIAKEMRRPKGFFDKEKEKALEFLKKKIAKDTELSKPSFADMASARKAMQYPAVASKDESEANKRKYKRLKLAYQSNNFVEMVADKSRSCESKGRLCCD